MTQKSDTFDEAEGERARETAEARARLLRLAKEQGVQPIQSIDDLQGDFWPEEESTEEFLAWLRETRQEGAPLSLPELAGKKESLS